METSPLGLALIKKYEGCRLTAYLDSVNVPTIGVGHTRGVKMGDVITMEQADQFLADDLADAEAAVNKSVKVLLKQHQFDALSSFTFNLGGGALAGSTLLKMLNKGNYEAAADQFGLWTRAGNKVLLGLVRRRAAERILFLSGEL